MSKPKTTIAIIGGGAAATLAATQLEAAFGKVNTIDIVLITGKAYFLHLVGGLRANVSSEEIADKICVPYDKLFKNADIAKIYNQKATEITANNTILLEDGTVQQFDYAIVATGKTWMPPLDLPEKREDGISRMKEYRDKVKAAQNIVIIGAGAVGLEMAGEINESYPEKSITIIHNASQVMNDTYNDKFRNGLKAQCDALGIKFVFNDRLDGDLDFTTGPQSLTTRNGVKVDNVDLVIQATGGSVNTQLLEKLAPPGDISKAGIKVRNTFQLKNKDNVFVIGDLADLPEQKQVAKIPGYVAVVVQNVRDLMNGAAPTKSYKGATPKELCCVNLGTKGGMAYIEVPLFGKTVLGPWFVRAVKAKSLFVEPTRKGLGYLN